MKRAIGMLMVARRPSFSPTDIAGLKLWLKADSLVLSDNDPVSTWADSSGLGNNVTGAGGARPLYKTNIQNGLPAIRFDGTDDTLTGTFTITHGDGFAVCNFNSAGNFPDYNGLYITQGGTLISDNFFGGDGSGSTNLYLPVAGYAYNSIRINKVNTLNFSPLTTTKLLAGVSGGIGAAPISKTSINIGNNPGAAGRFWNGDIFEIIVYDSTLSTTDRGKVEDYLNAKYLLF